MFNLTLKDNSAERIRKGYPWVTTKSLQFAHNPDVTAGSLVTLVDNKQNPLAIGYYNPNTTLTCRVLTQDLTTPIDEAFFIKIFTRALGYRDRLFPTPFYRLIHAEGDNCPGLIIDRFGDTLVCQTSTAGMEALKPFWFKALTQVLSPTRVIFRDNVALRAKEGLTLSVTAPIGELNGLIEVKENGALYFADPSEGQKTGWFFDQRANRRWVSLQTKNKTVLDLYSYSGGFGLAAAMQNAAHVTMVDSSEKALNLAKMASVANKVEDRCDFIQSDIFDCLPRLIEENRQFDVVIVDPPAFVKLQSQLGAGLRGYQKLAKLACQLVTPGGLFFMASCSHHASPTDFRKTIELGIQKADRTATFLRKGGADKDHPIHRLLPENHYLKSYAFQLD